jgi:hypothetical protein
MQYDEFIDNYSLELQLIDALDQIKDLSPDAAEILDRWVSHSKDEKSASGHVQMDPSSESSLPDTQSP